MAERENDDQKLPHLEEEEMEHCPHCSEHHARLEAIEKRLGIHREKPTRDEILRSRKRA